MSTSRIEETLAKQLTDAGISFVREHQFLSTRRFRFDFALLKERIAIECEGGLYGKPVICPTCKHAVRRKAKNGKYFVVTEGGRHTSAAGYRADTIKYNLAVLNGWSVLRFTNEDVKSGEALKFIRAFLNIE